MFLLGEGSERCCFINGGGIYNMSVEEAGEFISCLKFSFLTLPPSSFPFLDIELSLQ